MYKIINCEQSSPEWFRYRSGLITASNFSKAITKTGKPSASAEDLINKAVAELIIGEPEESFVSQAMERGTELEFEALDFINHILGYSFDKVGFLDSGLGYGSSPDGINEKDRVGLEIKCPLAHTHVSYLSSGGLPKAYYHQVQGAMLVSGFDRWLFVSYHPQIIQHVVLVERDNEFIEKLKVELLKIAGKVKERHKIILDKMF